MEKNEPIKSMDELAKYVGRRVRVNEVQVIYPTQRDEIMRYETHPNGEFFKGELRKCYDGCYIVFNPIKFKVDGTELPQLFPDNPIVVTGENDRGLLAARRVTMLDED